ncbi:MAG: DUF4199 domain-containing protein [Myxococcales bacterium FL481]|nr:MAG: DUF4199 domain-containing protein [Myxococcales bacterium FL481]
MSRIIIVYGSIAGSATIASAILGLQLGGGDTQHLAALEWLGYLVMLLALSVIFVGIKRYRDVHQGGVIRFRRAVLVGVGISAVASGVYVAIWEVHLALTDHAFIEEYTAAMLAEQQAAGVGEADLAAARAQAEQIKERYANPVYRVMITLSEIFPVGLLISLVAAAVLRTRKPA